MGDQARDYESLLGRVFDGYQNMMQIARCIRETAAQLGSPKPAVLELARRPAGISDYIPEAKLTRFETHQSDQPSLITPLVLPFADKAFDVSLVSDAYEHIPEELRPELLREMLRVTSGTVLVGAPNGDEIVSRFDRIVFDFIWGKYAERFEPLQQHIDYGLEPVEQTIRSLKALGATNAVALPCNYVYRWIHQILIYFDLQHRQPYLDLYTGINRIYNERMSPYDYREPCYRYLIVVPTDPRIDVELLVEKLKVSAEIPASLGETEGLLIGAFRAVDGELSSRLKWWMTEANALRSANDSLCDRLGDAEREVERLAEIVRLHEESGTLRLVRRFVRKVRRVTARRDD
ncbi:MAG TPA: hypothetical protein VFV34_06845 [Blastocatellia bacterium]|nr:hypothetical protein [Blastocatellia bacterium]